MTTPNHAKTTIGPDPDFLTAYARTRRFSLGYPQSIRFSPDGATVYFLRSASATPKLGLFALAVASGATRELITSADVLGGAAEHLSDAERARRERQRITVSGYTSYQISPDGRRLLAPLSGRAHVIEVTGESPHGWAATPDSATAIDPKFSPNGEFIAYVADQDVRCVDLASRRDWAVTTGGTAMVSHGLAEFVAQEEMGRHEGFWWSPDSRFIAYAEVDNSGVEVFSIPDPARPAKPAATFPYPRPGHANAVVRLGVVAVAGGSTTWVNWDRERYPYLARVLWREAAAPLSILVQTRDQRELAFLRVNPATGATTTLLIQRDAAWLDLDDHLPRWLPDGERFLWTTLTDAGPNLELRAADGSLSRELVSGESGFFAIQPDLTPDGVVALTATPITTRPWFVPFDGSPPTPLAPGDAERQAIVAPTGRHWVDVAATLDSPPTATLRGISGETLATLPATAESPPFCPNVELTTVVAANGQTYHCAITRPRGGAPTGQLPVIVSVYGGPTHQVVSSSQRAYLMSQWLADHGAIVVAIDNRGTPRRDRAWRVAVKCDLGATAIADQVVALNALGARYPELDLDRVGIFGWSFGGYMAALGVLRRPDVFKAAVAGAPVVDWRDYDTHYTERYMDTLDANPDGYDAASLLNAAPNLGRPLLLVHGTADDNVYFFNSLKLADALLRAGRRFDFLPLPGVTHQLADEAVIRAVHERTASYLMAALTG